MVDGVFQRVHAQGEGSLTNTINAAIFEEQEGGTSVDKELIAQWIEALESGGYKQGKAALRLHDSYCCLGVLCDVSGLSTWEKSSTPLYAYYDYTSVLPYQVADMVGLPLDGDGVKVEFDGYTYDSLIDANDNGVPFKNIAAALRAHYNIEQEG